MIQPIEKIKSLLSDEIVTLFGDDIINNAYNEAMKFVLNMLTEKSILESIHNVDTLLEPQWKTVTKADWEAGNFMRNRRLLKVGRKITGTTTHYEATELNFLNKDKFDNSSSIYYENNNYKPKWYVDEGNKLTIIPKDGETTPDGEIYYITMPEMGITDNASSSTFQLAGKKFSTITWLEEELIFIGIPHNARELVYIQIAINLTQNYISDFTYEEEDGEMLALIKEHLGALNAAKQENLNYVGKEYGTGIKSE
tara:strand:+ start:120 stop:881 length:762 start_codon:yes stop_codon:yes gene_type:complete